LIKLPIEAKHRPSSLSTAVMTIAALLTLSACEASKTPKPPKMPSIEEVKKAAPVPEAIDVKSYTEGNVVRDQTGNYAVPWHEKTTCDGPGSCKTNVINEVTQEVAIKDGAVQAPWKETGRGLEVARPAKSKPIEPIASNKTDTKASPK
jgi:hypothetical protein